MKLGRRTVAGSIAAACLPVLLLMAQGGSAGASTWNFFKLPGASGGSEPGIDIGLDADGEEVIYVHGTYGLPLHNKAWIRQPSKPEYNAPAINANQGFLPITFSSPYNRLPGGGDADIAFRGDDVWFIDLWLGSNSIQYSPDKGQTWTLGTPFTSLPLSDRQWIALGPTVEHPVTGEPQTTVYVTYQTVQPGDGTWVSRSRDNGLTWDFHTQIPGVSGIPAHIVTDGEDTVAVAVGSSGTWRVSVSKNEGQTWTTRTLGSGAGWAVGLSMNPEDSDEMALTYEASSSTDGGTSHKTIVRVTGDGGESWSAPIRLQPGADPLGPVDWFPWVDYRGDKIAVAWYQSSIGLPGRDPNRAAATNQWHVYHSESLDDGQSFSIPEQVTTRAAKTGPICTVGLSCNADRELGDFMQIAIDTNYKSWIVMVHVYPGPLGGGIYTYNQT